MGVSYCFHFLHFAGKFWYRFIIIIDFRILRYIRYPWHKRNSHIIFEDINLLFQFVYFCILSSSIVVFPLKNNPIYQICYFLMIHLHVMDIFHGMSLLLVIDLDIINKTCQNTKYSITRLNTSEGWHQKSLSSDSMSTLVSSHYRKFYLYKYLVFCWLISFLFFLHFS
jgi:hypothetical protein